MVLASNLGEKIISLLNKLRTLGRRSVAVELDLAALDTFEGSSIGSQGVAEVLLPFRVELGAGNGLEVVVISIRVAILERETYERKKKLEQ